MAERSMVCVLDRSLNIVAKPHLLIFGLGYSGLRLARECLADGWKVSGTVRSPEKAAALQKEGVSVYPFTQEGDLPEGEIRDVTHILDTTVPTEDGTSCAPELHRLSAMGIKPQWTGYISTTAVYGDCEGRWVDEATPPNPGSKQGRSRLKAEGQWLDWAAKFDVAAHIFRLPGLYGPGRCALDQVTIGRARRIHREGHRTSRIHVDDVNGAIKASMAKPNGGRIYNVADDQPTPNADVINYACELLNCAPPPLEQYADLAPTDPRLRFLKESRLVSNQRLKHELDWKPMYPTYREGLDHALATAPPSLETSAGSGPQI